MRDRQPRISPSLSLFVIAASACAEPDAAHERSTAALEQSAAAHKESTAALGQSTAAVGPLATPGELVAALDIPLELRPVPLSLVSPDPAAAFVRSSFGAIQPRKGTSFLVLSTGRSDTPGTAEPGTDFGAAGPAGDVVTLRFLVTVPPGANRLSFDTTFLSAEYPEFIGTASNDTFTARVTDALGTRTIAIASVNTSAFYPAATTNVGDGPFMLYVDDPTGVDTIFNNGPFLDAGTTGWQTVHAAIAGGGEVTLELDIRDLGTGILDSAVIVDNVSFSAVELVDPRSGLLDPSGRLVRDPAQLAAGADLVDAVVADGVTQVLVRAQVPGPGLVTLTLPLGAGAEGSVSSVEGTPVWTGAVTTIPVLVGGAHYAFFLYRSPPAFNRGGDALLQRREAELSLHFMPVAGPQYLESFSIGIVRPPVVIVLDLWSSCLSWTSFGSLMQRPLPAGDPRGVLTVSCVDYAASRGLSDPANRAALSTFINVALSALRGAEVAATQVDVIGHGMGGLLARLYIDGPTYVRPDNFNAGSIHRLITMNTPHLGARIADEIVRFRNSAKDRQIWNDVNGILQAAGIFIDDAQGDVAIDDMRSDSPVINGIGGLGSGVSHHALVSTGGRAIARTSAIALLTNGLRVLYTSVENYHPKVSALPVVQRQKLIFGTLSLIFCPNGVATPDDDHDLFATVWEQKGGLSAPFITQFLVTPSIPSSSHFRVHNDPAHTTRLLELLNAPNDSGLFASSMPPPATVPRRNSCPMTIP